jgi:redox-sensitive bicupin YhaK (pirin superfamily)
MIAKRPAAERGVTNIGWLDSKHTFSFNRYHDPNHMGFGSLRVINDDIVRPGAGFGRHPHQDMEIISWVLDGALAHEDSTGSRAVLHAGHVQRMSAGTGIVHSEFNASSETPVHFLQIWIQPNQLGIAPRFEDLAIAPEEVKNRLRLIASPDARDGSSHIQQDAYVYIAALDPGAELSHRLAQGRRAWLQVARGSVTLNGETLRQGDGAAITGESQLTVAGLAASDIMLFDLA